MTGAKRGKGGPTRQDRRHGRSGGGLAWLKSKLTLGAVGWVLVLGYVGYQLWPQAEALFGVEGVVGPAPAYRLTTLTGEEVSSGSLEGKVVLVNFWATWCPPCRLEMPGFQDVYEARKEDGFRIVGVSMDRTGTEPVERFLRERGITYPVGMANSEVFRAFDMPRTLPASYLLDRQGRIRHTVVGVFTEVALARAVDRLLAED